MRLLCSCGRVASAMGKEFFGEPRLAYPMSLDLVNCSFARPAPKQRKRSRALPVELNSIGTSCRCSLHSRRPLLDSSLTSDGTVRSCSLILLPAIDFNRMQLRMPKHSASASLVRLLAPLVSVQDANAIACDIAIWQTHQQNEVACKSVLLVSFF